ncbi:MAG: TolC family protein [Gemmatimonadota bacterium]|nr:TolC family protein [Gemmatimonadota bacterium]
MKYQWALVGLLIATTCSTAEVLSLQECIDLAMQNNLQHQRNQQDLDNSHVQLTAAQAPFTFGMDAFVTAPSFTGLRDTQENVALQTRVREENTDVSYSGNLRMTQRLRHLGQFTLTSAALRRDFSSNRREDFLDYSGSTRLAYERDILAQPSEEIALKRAEHSLQSARLNFDRQRLQLEGQVIDDYYDLVQSVRELEIEEQRLAQSRANLELAQRKFEVGLIAEVEALRLQVEMLQAEATYDQAQTDIELRRDLLRETLGLDVWEPITIDTDVQYEIHPIDAQRALEIGLARRTDMKRAEIFAEINELNLAEARRRNGINATFGANVSMQGRGSEISAVSDNFERNRWGVDLQISLPLIDSGQRQANISQARIALEQSRLGREQQRRQIIQQVRDATRRVHEAERQIDLRQAALEFAQRTYDVEQSRFELGLADSQQLLQAQGNLTQARINALAAVIGYQRQLKNVRLATMAELKELAP